LVRVAKEFGLEGIVAKRKDSVYESGKRTGAWVKYKVNRGQELVIGGYTPGNPFDAVISSPSGNSLTSLAYIGSINLSFVRGVLCGFIAERCIPFCKKAEKWCDPPHHTAKENVNQDRG
jgi:bifunctional non-homologous end joining protein LigD